VGGSRRAQRVDALVEPQRRTIFEFLRFQTLNQERLVQTADRLRECVREAATHSKTTLAIVLAKREANPHMRYHYCLSTTFNQTGAMIKPEVVELFERVGKNEATLDPILCSPYPRTWDQAQVHARQIAKPIPS
jgi:hypothetical protein